MVKLAAVLKVKVKLLSHVQLFPTSWTVAYQVPPSMGFSRQEYWSGLPFTKASQMKADHIVNKKKKKLVSSIHVIAINTYTVY